MNNPSGKITVVIPRDARIDGNLMTLIVKVNQIARGCNLEVEIYPGECISPVSVSGDLSLSVAELIKQKALGYFNNWQDENGGSE